MTFGSRIQAVGGLFALLLPACGAILGIEAGTLDDAGEQMDGPQSATDSDGRRSFDSRVEGTSSYDAGLADVSVADGLLPTEAAPLADAAFAGGVVYVSLNGDDSSGCGTHAAPCLTIQRGVATAQRIGAANVFVSEGVYHGSVNLSGAGPLTVRGGLNARWEALRGPGANRAVVLQATTSDWAVNASGLAAPVTMATLMLSSKSTAAPGETLYGVFATGNGGTTLELDDVIVEATAGGDGETGQPGTPGSGQPATCSPVKDTGASGRTGNVAAGVFSDTGFVPGNGGSGGAGADGVPGGTPPSCVDCGSCGALCGFDKNTSGLTMSCGTSATGVCGGKGGAGGQGGGGGGSSVGLFLWNATVAMKGGAVVAGNAGAGAPGGAGGAGAAGGTNGQAGSAGPTCVVSCTASIAPPSCTSNNGAGAAGSVGGMPGAGGTGGAGAGGAGGSSYAVYAGGGSSFNYDGTTLVAGSPGMGSEGASSGSAATEGP